MHFYTAAVQIRPPAFVFFNFECRTRNFELQKLLVNRALLIASKFASAEPVAGCGSLFIGSAV
jgi:hypothetical protein